MSDWLSSLFKCWSCRGLEPIQEKCSVCDGTGIDRERLQTARKAHDPRNLALRLLGKDRIAFPLRFVEHYDEPVLYKSMARTYKKAGEFPQRDSSHFARLYRDKIIKRDFTSGILDRVYWTALRLPEAVKSLQDEELHNFYELYENKTFDPVAAKLLEPWREEYIDMRCFTTLKEEIDRRR